MQQNPRTPGVDPKRPSRKRRWLRRLTYLLAILLLFGGFGLWLVTRSWFIIARVKPALEQRLGGVVTIGSASYQGGNRFLLNDLIIRVPTLQGEAGQIARIQQAIVGIDLSGLGRYGVRLSEVEVDGLLLRVSEDVHAGGRMNFMMLDPKWTSDPRHKASPPKVEIRNAVIEYGTHTGDQYTLQGLRRVAGEMYPTNEEGWYSFELAELDRRGLAMGEHGLHVKGQWNARTNEHSSRVDGLELDERTLAMLPQTARVWFDPMKLEGRVDAITESWKPNEPVAVEMVIQNVGLTLPIDAQDLWARYRDGKVEPTASRPRMRVRSGIIRLASDKLELKKMVGELASSDPNDAVVGVPYSVNLTIESLPRIDWDNKQQWMEGVLKTAPFTMNFQMENFELKPTPENPKPAIDLPKIVAKSMSKFGLSDWVLSTSVDVTRAAPSTDEYGRLVEAKPITKGQAYVHKAIGKYQKFPYPLKNVDGYVQFDNDKITVQYLNGDGSGAGKIRINGDIAPPDNDAKISLHLVGKDLPVDEALHEALKAGEAQALDVMFHKPSFDSLVEAGLLADEADINLMQDQRAAMATELERLKAGGVSNDPQKQAAVADLEQRLKLLQRRIDAGPFHLGGIIDLDLKIERAFGDDQPTDTSGILTVQEAGLMYEKFPYPIMVKGGALRLTPHAITIEPGPDGKGLPLATPGGGRGYATGEFLLPGHNGEDAHEPSQHLRPNLHIRIEHEQCNDLWYACIPLNKLERAETHADEGFSWPGRKLAHAAELVRGIGLAGEGDCEGSVGVDPHGRVNYDFTLQLQHAIAQPTQQLAGAIGSAGLLWPAGFTLHEVNGTVRVMRDAVSIQKFEGQHDQMRLNANGQVDFRGDLPDTAIDIDLHQMPIGPYVLNLAPVDQLARAKAIWDRHQPQGVFDASLAYRANAQRGEHTRMNIMPSNFSVLLDQQRENVQRAGGELLLDSGQIVFNDLSVDLSAAEHRSDGRLTLNGRYGLADTGDPFNVKGTWTGGKFESSLITEAIHLMGADQAARDYRAYQPSGSFDATFEVQPAMKDQPATYSVLVHPKEAALTIDQIPVHAEFDHGEVAITPGQIAFADLAGHHAGGSFSGTGVIRTITPLDVNMALNYQGRLVSGQVLAFLPAAVRDALSGIQFDDGGPSRLSNCTFHLAEVEGDVRDQRSEISGQPPKPGQSDPGASARVESSEVSDQKSEVSDPTSVLSTQHSALSTSMPWRTDFHGTVETRGATFTAGLPFNEVDGAFEITVHHEPGSAPQLEVTGSASHLRVLGQELRDAAWPVRLEDNGTTVNIPWFRAKADLGTIAAQAKFGVGDDRDYQAQVELVGVPLDGFLRSQRSESEGQKSEVGGQMSEGNAQHQSNGAQHSNPIPSGEVYASFGICGVRDHPETRAGRAIVRVLHGKMASVPLLMQIVKMTQFTAPVVGELNGANLEMYLKGDRVIFERILFESTLGNNALLQLIGEGEMNFDTLELDMRFRSRGGVILVRDIVGGVSDQLYQIQVTGPLNDPKTSVVPLPSMK